MPEYGFSLTRTFPYKDRIKDRTYDSALIQENIGQKKPVLWHFLRSGNLLDFCIARK